jgi:hypothetical protein
MKVEPGPFVKKNPLYPRLCTRGVLLVEGAEVVAHRVVIILATREYPHTVAASCV